MAIDIETLTGWDDRIRELVSRYQLNCYPQEFEICDYNEMIGYMAYSGMPARYRHWSFGKTFEKQKTMYEYGVSGLPYEMVINSNPCLAYLMRDNSLLLQILTIAHVYGHNDFFANNFTFTSATDASYTLEMFKNHASRIESYIEDPSIGIERVEEMLDRAHALCYQSSRNLAYSKLNEEEARTRALQQAMPAEDPHWQIHPPKAYTTPDLTKNPLEPVEDLLSFIANNNPYLSEWQKDILRIVEKEWKYFIPQMETKIMNEGWASYWHYKIMNQLNLPTNLQMEFLVRHNQVLCPHPGGLNPYHLGFVIWHDIERRWNNGETGMEFSSSAAPKKLDEQDENETPGRKKIFEVRLADRDSSFLRRFLTPELMRSLELFQHEKRGDDRIITKLSDNDSWKEVKETLIRNIGLGSIPVIKVEDSDFGRTRTLYLKHYHDGRDLDLNYAEQTLSSVKTLWERPVYLETIINARKTLLKLEDNGLKTQLI